MENLKAIVLAAGKGKRMHSEDSDLPKVMREALGRPLLGYVLEALPVENPQDAVIVVGYKREKVIDAYPERTFAVQAEQKGTGHAVASAREALEGFSGDVLVCCGDTPLITRETLEGLCRAHR
ncbi:MAG: NTP transferase domain-containing protein, partial [Oscillospiraceae bacterium]|nr:NTP transferase domain-containing protein [Oscillospiraceae bacterium]MBQ3951668.1 NTP transferase domain-containing protein [Oscillospiraceae bacterium]